ncbi:nuclear transport factor 2 family protein [Photobacterium sp. WH77]|uniref:nuclear transport factor 2 family protein n=1 Tax=Photobacterium TaxID=657 RepID=UPI001EDB1EFE|nr:MULTISPECIES: nuclear transport factor 2 family protein [Photobacterium]MCG2837524.1 nuclear transport factor 2 family protein [Photobacterium sp. WH77]MCG2845140.1 nuclear transport factor 2 family protein [Photobacterium sp. WH80]MDO6583147.1 nuclear transport factor 2 family protein [Photobacterium sp. 2_MG-2023]
MESDIVQEIFAVEEKLKASMLSSDTVALTDLLSDALVFINHFGQRVSKQDDIALHRSGLLSIESIELRDFQVVPQGNIALVHVNADIKGKYDGAKANGVFAFSRVWLKQNNKWQLISAQSTVIS